MPGGMPPTSGGSASFSGLSTFPLAIAISPSHIPTDIVVMGISRVKGLSPDTQKRNVLSIIKLTLVGF